MIQENLKYFRDKESILLNAIYRTDKILKECLTNVRPLELSNYVHDLRYRLENRLKDLHGKYYDWHFDKYGFNSYDVII